MQSTCRVCGLAVRCWCSVVVFWSQPTHSEQIRCASTIATACIMCVYRICMFSRVVECAQYMRSVRSSGSVHVRCGVSGTSWSPPTRSDQFRLDSTVARACIVCVDCSSVFGSGGGLCKAHAECAVSGGSVHVCCCVYGATWSPATHSDQLGCASTIARALIMYVDCC